MALIVLRIIAIGLVPEPDNDAYGHFRIARAVLAQPWRIDLHWVWLPGYHFLLAGLIRLGASFTAIRIGNALLASALPVLLFAYASRWNGPDSRAVALTAALYCALAPVVNLLSISAQQETLFTVSILLAVWSFDAERHAAAGVFLALASMLRYEAWGAVVLLVGLRLLATVPRAVNRLPEWIRRATRVSWLTLLLPLLAMGSWLLAHRLTGGKWFGFLNELYAYTRNQRLVLHRSAWMELSWFPVIQPVLAFGLGLVALPFGLKRALRPGWVIPLGIYLFLLASYSAKGSLGSGRYYDALAPFVCLASAHGTLALAQRRRGLAWVLAGGVASSVIITLALILRSV